MIANRLKFDDDHGHDERRRKRRPMFELVCIDDDEPSVSIAVWPVLLVGAFLLGVVVGGVAVLLLR